MDKFGLIGDPIATSQSPALFRAGYGGKYQYDLIEGAVFEASWQKFISDYKAVNVTAPFKEAAYAKVKIMTKACAKIGATNLVVKTADGLEAHNSDFSGIILCVADALMPGVIMDFYGHPDPAAGDISEQVLANLRTHLSDLYPEQPTALVVGCGGAGRAATVAAAEMGFKVTLMNRTLIKAANLVADMGEYDLTVRPIDEFENAFAVSDLVIYTIPKAIDAIAALKTEDFESKDRYASFRPAKVILEANYKDPAFTGSVLRMASYIGCQYIPGRKWLLYQALTGYSTMTGEQPDFHAMASIR